jgi:membrane-associated protease RseP (regulator of RpoE activity)
VVIAEPATTRWDLSFSVRGIPVRIHPMFWVITIVLGAVGPRATVLGVTLWVAAVFLSILVHELGHAFVARAHGWPPRVTLYAMGGVASYRPTRHTISSRILIAFAGPGAGFVLGALILALILLTGHSTSLPGLPIDVGNGPPIAGRLGLFVDYTLFVSVFWGLVNLAPIHPLDGSTIATAAIEKFRPRDALRISAQLSLAAAVGLAVAGLVIYRSPFITVMFAMLGYGSWQMLQQIKAHRA